MVLKNFRGFFDFILTFQFFGAVSTRTTLNTLHELFSSNFLSSNKIQRNGREDLQEHVHHTVITDL
jgi:hypothetical protein